MFKLLDDFDAKRAKNRYFDLSEQEHKLLELHQKHVGDDERSAESLPVEVKDQVALSVLADQDLLLVPPFGPAARFFAFWQYTILPKGHSDQTSSIRKSLQDSGVTNDMAPYRDLCTSMFDFFAEDGKGDRSFITLDEFNACLRAVGLKSQPGFSDDEMRLLFCAVQMESEGDGELSKLDFTEFMEALSMSILISSPNPYTPMKDKVSAFFNKFILPHKNRWN